MAAWDNVSLPSAPAAPSYAAPLLDFKSFGDLGKNYFEGTQMGRTRGLQTAFKDGLPKNPDGSVDIRAATDTLAKLGGADAAMPLLQLQMQQQQGQADAEAIQKRQPVIVPPHGIPDQVPPRQQQPEPSGGVGASASGSSVGNNPGSLISAIGSAGIPDDKAGFVASTIAGRLGIDPNAAITDPKMQANVSRQLQAYQAAQKPAPQQVAQSSGQVSTQAEEAQREKYAADLRTRAAFAERFKGIGAGKALLDQATAEDNAVKQLRESRLKDTERTLEQKNLSSGTTVKAEELKNEVVQSQKTYNGIQAAATQFQRTLKPAIDMAKGILNRPEMYSGIGGNISLDFNKVKAALGDQKAAALQEGLQKINAISVLSQVNQQRDELQEAGGASARIFSQQVDQVAKASASLENTVYGNRFLVNFQSRMGDLSTEIARQARDYITTKGHLDPKFDQQISNYIQKNPVFNKQEISDPRILGAPEAPPALADKNSVVQWATKMGLKSGDPFRTPDGQVRYLP